MISVKNVSFSYHHTEETRVLNAINMEILDGQFVILLGQSGSGKTTLLNIIGGLLKPDTGVVTYNNESIYSKTPTELCQFRNENIGFVFQNFFLENRFSAIDNVMLPLLLNKSFSKDQRKKRALEVLGKVGLSEKADRKPTELSGGESQRVSIARALANSPQLIIADEPTGNLDTVNGNHIISLLKEQSEYGKTVLMVTHNENYCQHADKIFRIVDGVIGN